MLATPKRWNSEDFKPRSKTDSEGVYVVACFGDKQVTFGGEFSPKTRHNLAADCSVMNQLLRYDYEKIYQVIERKEAAGLSFKEAVRSSLEPWAEVQAKAAEFKDWRTDS